MQEGRKKRLNLLFWLEKFQYYITSLQGNYSGNIKMLNINHFKRGIEILSYTDLFTKDESITDIY